MRWLFFFCSLEHRALKRRMHSFCTPILSKPKPKPKTETPTPSRTETPTPNKTEEPTAEHKAPMTEGEADLVDAEAMPVDEVPPEAPKTNGMDVD